MAECFPDKVNTTVGLFEWTDPLGGDVRECTDLLGEEVREWTNLVILTMT